MISVLFPKFCALCKAIGADLCTACAGKLKPLPVSQCTRCGHPFDAPVAPHPCAACLAQPPDFDKHRSLFFLEDSLRGLIHRFKYDAHFGLRRGFAQEAKRFKDEFSLCDLIVPIPLHLSRLRSRGYNQSWILAQDWARLLERPARSDVLTRVKDTPSQTTLDKSRRLENLKGAFVVDGRLSLTGKTVLLVDDVHTTGATLQVAAAALKAAGAKSVLATTVAYTL